MFKKNQQFGVYSIKDVLHADDVKTCCLTEDPFFYSTVILNVFAVETLEINAQKRNLGTIFDRLHLLEHPGIAAIYDSGFEGDFFYYTTSYNYQESLADILESQSVSDPVALFAELAASCAYAAEQEVSHGHIGAQEIHFNDQGRAQIADFGVSQSFSLLIENRPFSEQIAESLNSFGLLLLQLLTGADDCIGRETELLAQLDEEPIREIAADLLGFGEHSFSSFDELCEALKAQQLPEENNSVEENVAPQADDQPKRDDGAITIREKTEVLPQVRRLIDEKNKLILQLDKASLEQNRVVNQLSQAHKTITDLENRQEVTDIEVTRGWGGRFLLVYALGGFVLGLLVAGVWGGFANNDQDQSPVVVSQALPEPVGGDVIVPELPLEPVVNDVEEAVEKAVEIENESIQPELPVVVKDEAQPEPEAVVQTRNELIPEAAPVDEPAGWWPAGQEFSEDAPFSEEQVTSSEVRVAENSAEISAELKSEILERLNAWASAWSNQDAQAYLEHYSDAYRPGSGSTRMQWAAERTRKLEIPDWIKIRIDNIRLERLGAERLSALFEQNYQSNSYQDYVSKEIELVLEEGQWKIVREKNRPL